MIDGRSKAQRRREVSLVVAVLAVFTIVVAITVFLHRDEDRSVAALEGGAPAAEGSEIGSTDVRAGGGDAPSSDEGEAPAGEARVEQPRPEAPPSPEGPSPDDPSGGRGDEAPTATAGAAAGEASEADGEGSTSAQARSPAPGGVLDSESIRDTIRENMGFFRFCFEWTLLQQPALEGRVTMAFTIAEDGSVREAHVVEDGLGSDDVSRCFQGVTSRMRFPPPAEGEVRVNYPFRLAEAPEPERLEGI